jgi:short-subunit dehydrogenase
MRDPGSGVSTIFPGFIRDAGMFAKSEVKLPRGVRTRSPEDVAKAVVRAIERDKAEIDVAPFGLRIGAAFAGLAPEISGQTSRRMGAGRIAAALAAAQRESR